MSYRREIDGLRAIAVLPVILFHAGFDLFRGGYVGVDVFFVISGFLITSVIREQLKKDSFSISKFYESRARRILPALFLVMFVSLAFGLFALMPDALKNFGQSLVATTLFSNNMLLAVTAGYWDLASEFKPLLHTWSLGVEEQYYLIIPLLLLILWKAPYAKSMSLIIVCLLFTLSLLSAVYVREISPNWAFYSLPTRAWEILLGAALALFLEGRARHLASRSFSAAASLFGLLLISVAIFTFKANAPEYLMLVPTIGTALVIAYAREPSVTYSFLASRLMVLIGLMSYSIYLWHQPIFAFTRACSVERPALFIFALLVPAILFLSYLSWRFIETPFRNRRRTTRRFVLSLFLVFGILLVSAGLYLNSSYGLLSRVYGPNVTAADMDKRTYNERVFTYEKDKFSQDSRTKILIVGDSFARDFVNITLEGRGGARDSEIIYQNGLSECLESRNDDQNGGLFVSADVIVFARRSADYENCAPEAFRFAAEHDKQIYYVGPKEFGYNLNWLIWLDRVDRENRYNPISDEIIWHDEDLAREIPSQYYISLLSPVLRNKNEVPITDSEGILLSTDRLHLTKYGAIYFWDKVVQHTNYAENFR